MKIPRAQQRLRCPRCVFEEPMPHSAFKLLTYLLDISDSSAAARPGYAMMREITRDGPSSKGCNTSVRRALSQLKELGWIFCERRTQRRLVIFMQIPARLRSDAGETKGVSVISVVA